MLKKHFRLLVETKNEKIALLEIRSQAAWYMKGISGCSSLKQEVYHVKDEKSFYDLIDHFIEEKRDIHA